MIYTQTTHSLCVTVLPAFEEAQSSPQDNHYVWTYNVVVENLGEQAVQLMKRYWQVIDAAGSIQEVRGEGVVGKQPVLHPGETFEYTSEAHLRTSSGIMRGSYQMFVVETGEELEVAIPAFSLDTPYEQAHLH